MRREPVSRSELTGALAGLEARLTSRLYRVVAAIAGLTVALEFFP